MEKKLLEISGRIKELREILEIDESEVCRAAGVSAEEYREIEDGKRDFSATFLIKVAEVLGVDVTDLLTGESPKLSGFTVSKSGEGLSINRREGFEYKNLAYLFKNRLGEPFYVKAPYREEEQNKPIAMSTHEGQEFDYILKGKLKVQIKDKTVTLNEGDTIYYDSASPHGMIAVGGAPCEFLAILLKK